MLQKDRSASVPLLRQHVALWGVQSQVPQWQQYRPVLLRNRWAKVRTGRRVSPFCCPISPGGQIWPFGYLVKRFYPLLAGRYEVGPMTVIVCRGTGTWGPRMRLWLPGEIVRVRLHRAE